jgi:hypothetical protein
MSTHSSMLINGPSYRLKDRMLEQRDGGDGGLS